MRKVPCKNCENRHLACHDTCEAYKQFAKENEESRKQLTEENFNKSTLYAIKRRRYYQYDKSGKR